MTHRTGFILALAALTLGTACFGGDADPDPGRNGQEMTFRGAYAREGGAPRFTECETGIVYPVAPEGKLDELEEAIREVRSTSDDPLLVSFRGRLEPRPGSDGEAHDAVVVLAFEAVHFNAECAATEPGPPLEGTDWRAVQIMGTAMTADDPPTLALDPQNGLLGWSGCRPVTGVYTLQGGQLRFGALERPDLPCDGSLRYEQLYLGALRGTGSYEMSRDTLRLVGESGVLGVFVGR